MKDQLIKAGQAAFVKLGIKCAAWGEQNGESRNVSWLLMPRSSISKTPLRLANSVGLIDAGYRGEIMAVVGSIKTIDRAVRKGDRIAQGVAFDGGEIQLQIVDELDITSRGEGGFGSTSAVPARSRHGASQPLSALTEPNDHVVSLSLIHI